MIGSYGMETVREEIRERAEERARRREVEPPVMCDCGRIQEPGERFVIGPDGFPVCPECEDERMSDAN